MVDYRERFGVSELSQETSNGTGVRVAVLDTGIPRIDDIFICLSDNFTVASAKDSGHASFIGSILFGHNPIVGMCNSATACFAKVFDGLFASPDIVARAIYTATDKWNVDVINLSLGFSRDAPCPSCVLKACQHAYDKGVVIVAAAGNDGGKVLWPAALKEVISVGSTDGKSKDDFSNHGEVDFVVPGRDLEGYDKDGNVVTKSGTSFSAAVIAGMVAIIIAKMKNNGDKISVRDIKNRLIAACTDIDQEGFDTNTGFGIPFMTNAGRKYKKRGWLKIRSIYAKILQLVKKVFD